jgi:hypothetical protein
MGLSHPSSELVGDVRLLVKVGVPLPIFCGVSIVYPLAMCPQPAEAGWGSQLRV